MVRRQLPTALAMCALMTAVLGIVYPLAVTALAQLTFRHEANGSIIEVDGRPVASELVGQSFDGAEWFHPRPSAAGDAGYDAMASSGSNLGPTSPELLDAVAERVEGYRAENDLPPGTAVPVDAVTASGSGLDPHISVANARLQAPRVAEARGVDLATVTGLIDANTEHRPLGVLGDTAVNVVTLNIDLSGRGPS